MISKQNLERSNIPFHFMIHHTARPISIRMTMEPHIPGSVSQSIGDCALEISQEILGNNPMNVMRLDHKLTQRVHSESYVRTRVDQEH